jgi:hypothetical protein
MIRRYLRLTMSRAPDYVPSSRTSGNAKRCPVRTSILAHDHGCANASEAGATPCSTKVAGSHFAGTTKKEVSLARLAPRNDEGT